MSEQMDIAWMVNVDDGNVLISNEWIPLLGDCVLKESLAGVNFRSDRNHFSDQSRGAERMFATLSSWVTGGRVLELFSGVGALSVLLASQVDTMITVENNQASVELAQETMSRLGHSHIDCRRGDAYAIETLLTEEGPFDVIVVDPPGKGLGPELIKTINESGVSELLMLACRANALERFALLLEGGFNCRVLLG